MNDSGYLYDRRARASVRRGRGKDSGSRSMTTFTVPSGVTSSGITVNSGDTWIIDGTAVSFTISNGGTEVVSSSDFASPGGSAVSTTVSNGGFLYTSVGGLAVGTTVSSGGFEIVSGGVASATTVSSSGFEIVYNGAARSTTVENGGYVAVSGSFFSYVTVSSGGYVVVLPNALVTSPTVLPGGELVVISGGVSLFNPTSGPSYSEAPPAASSSAVA